jgi:C4-dicarboxylate transporter DctM subunit
LLGVLKEGFWALLSPIIILGGIYSGIFSPTEAACVSVIYSIVVSVFIYRTVNIKRLWDLILESVQSCAPLCMLLALATAFSRVLTMLNAPQNLAILISTVCGTRFSFLILLNAILLILGMFIDGAPAILILSPLLMPVAQQLGIDPVHLGVVIVANLTVGLASPPFGLNLFVASTTSGVQVMKIGRAAIPFIAMFIIALLIITFVPQLSLCLVK